MATEQQTEKKPDKKINKDVPKKSGTNLFATNKHYLRLPHDTVESLNVSAIDNYNLKLNKTVHFFKIKNNRLQNSNTNNEPVLYRSAFKDRNDYKGKYFDVEFDFDSTFIKEISDRQIKTSQQVLSEGYIDDSLMVKTSWRMALGLGHASVYETGMTLHHIYGIPYIPASSIKGVVRSWIITQLYGHNADSEAIAFNKEKVLCDVFGCPDSISWKEGDKPKSKKTYYGEHKKEFGFSEKKGDVLFFDALPTEKPTVEADIMNVHYKDCYNDSTGKKPPTDFQQPNPIPFLTVKDTSFQFIIGSKKQDLKKYEIANKTITQWLREALTEYGIGAKTAVGYGYME